MAYGPNMAEMQAKALEQAQAQDVPMPVGPTPDVPPSPPIPGNEDQGKDVMGRTAAEGGRWDKPYDEQWTHQLRNRLLKSGMVSEADIAEQALMDPNHRKWLNSLLKQWSQNQKEGGGGGQGGGEEEEQPQAPPPENAPGTQVPETIPPAASNNNVKPRVLAGGRLPSGEIFQTTAGPWGSGWIPTGDGLYWPPWPSAGGPIAKPSPKRRMGTAEPMPKTLTAEGQADAMEGWITNA
jgi:hypothetical protein